MSHLSHRIKQGFFMAGTSIRWVLQNPKILWFPLINLTLLITFAIVALVVFMSFEQWDLEAVRLLVKSYQQTYAEISISAFTLFAGYLFFVVSYFTNVALIHFSASRLNEQPVSIRQSINVALQRWVLILAWSAIEIAVIVPLALISGTDTTTSFVLGNIVAAFVSLLYTAATFFVPVFIAEEPQSIWTTVTKSFELMKQRLGEVVGFALGFMIINFLFLIIISIILVGISAVAGLTLDRLLQVHGFGIAFLVISAIFIQLLRALVATAFDAFKAALYNDTQSKKSGPFAPHLTRETNL